MKTTSLMMKFVCDTCGLDRPYGTAEGDISRPYNSTPRIFCALCKRSTVHHFSRVSPYWMKFNRMPDCRICDVVFSERVEA